MNNIPNKPIRTVILILIMLIFLGTSIYVGITKDNNILLGESLEDIYYDEMYNDYYEDYDDYDDEYEDDYDDYYDDYYDDEFADGELDTASITVTSLYEYVKYYPYVEGLKDSFKVSELTEEEKLRLVMASLKSKKVSTSQAVTDAEETSITINGKTYTSTSPNIRYKTYEVSSMYSEIFGSTLNADSKVLMYDGDNVIYKYNETANGYVKYSTENHIELAKANPQIIKAERKDKNIELHLKTGTKTDIYVFSQKTGYNYVYDFIEKKSDQTKNSL